MTNDVFFLGAGFSKAIDDAYPTLNDLTNEINRNYQAEKVSVAMHLHNEIPDSYKNNVELLLTFLSSNLPYKSDVQVSTDEALYKDITSKIAKYFQDKNKTINLEQSLNKAEKLIRFILKSKCTCITLNYDLLLEQLLDLYCTKINKRIENDNLYNIPLTELSPKGCIRFQGIDDPDEIYRADLPDIIKLHGSINWGVVSYNSDTIYYIEETEEEYKKAHLQTYIIPPVMDKTPTYSNHVIKAIWQRAYKKLIDADNIYIYGFSFPPTDLSIRFLFQSALSNNNKNPKIYVINTANAKNENSEYYLQDRFNEIFKGYEVNYDYCCDNSLEKFTQEIIEPKLEIANAN